MWPKSEDLRVCVICHEYFIGAGFSALPVATGRCCARCLKTTVQPERLHFDTITKGEGQ